MESTLHIPFGVPVAAQARSLRIEQEEWETTTGQVTKSGLYSYLYGRLTANIVVNNVNCGFSMVDGVPTVFTTIYVYLPMAEFPYAFHTSYGMLGAKAIDRLEQKEIINFSLSKSHQLVYLPGADVEYSWVGAVYDVHGAVTPAPEVSFEGGSVLLNKIVYGSLRVEYGVLRHKYVLQAPIRAGVEEVDLFGAVVYAIYDGGISWLELEPPPGIDALLGGGGSNVCGYAVIPADVPDDEYQPPTECPKADRTIDIDYCSQEVLSDDTFEGTPYDL